MSSAPDEVRIGVIGAGRIAIKHLEVLNACPGARLAGITSRTRSRAEALAGQFGGAPVFDDADALVRDARPDALLVLVSADQIHAAALDAMRFRLPLLIEKPAGLTPAESAALAQRADALGVRTMVGYNRRHYSIFKAGLEIVRSHGPLMGVLVEGHERMGAIRRVSKHGENVLGSWLYANATHTIDLLRFFGGEAQQVQCLTHRYREPLGDQFGALLEFESGAMGHYVSHWLSPGGWRVVLYGDGVSVEFKPLESGRWTDMSGETHDLAPSAEDQRFKPGFFGQMEAFCALVRDPSARSPIDLAGAHRTMLLAERMAHAAVDRGTLRPA
jgi:predicted dehydrogenase